MGAAAVWRVVEVEAIGAEGVVSLARGRGFDDEEREDCSERLEGGFEVASVNAAC